MRYYIDNRLDADETLVGKHDYTKEPKNYKLELKAFTKQVKKLLKLRQLEEAEKKAILEQLMNREKFNKEQIIALMEQQKMKNRIPTLLSKKQVNKKETKDVEQSQPPIIDTKEPIQQDNQETEVTVETDIEYAVNQVMFQVMDQMKGIR